MIPKPKSITGAELYQFAESHADAWSGLRGAKLLHASLGAGTIVSIDPREGYVPLISIQFDSDKTPSEFNTHVFAIGMIAKIEIPGSLQETLSLWKDQLAIEKAAQEIRDKEKQQAAEREKKLAADRKIDAVTRIIDPRTESYFFITLDQSDREKQAREESNSYAKALRRRVSWLRDWAAQIRRGGTGLEPVWSQGNFAADLLAMCGIESLWHFTDVRNLEGILREGGLLSFVGLRSLDISDTYLVADDFSRSCDERLGRDRYIRMSFIPNSWFFHRVRHRTPLVWLRFSTKALTLGEVLYSFGNAASGAVTLQDDLRTLGIDWESVKSFSGSFTNEEGPTMYPSRYLIDGEDALSFNKEKNSWNSEVLIKHFLPLEFCEGIFVCNTGKKIEIL